MAKRITGCALAAAWLLFGPAPRACPQASTTAAARAVVVRAVQACGGEATLRRCRAVQTRVRGTFFRGAIRDLPVDVAFTLEASYQLPNQYKEVKVVEVNGRQLTLTTVFDGVHGWQRAGGQPKRLDDAQLAEAREEAHLLRIIRVLPLLDRGFTLTTLPDATVEGRAAVGVRAACKGHPDALLHFDKETGLLLRVQRHTSVLKQDLTEERLLSDYRAVDGVQSPRKTVVYLDGRKMMEAEVVQARFLERLDERVFSRP